MSSKLSKFIKTAVKIVLHFCVVLAMCFYIFCAFIAGPYDDHFIGQKIINTYLLEFCTKACFFGAMINAVIAWLSFKKTKVFSIIYMILGTICLARLVWLLTL